MSKRVLVTGATGFIGCALTPYLVHQGFAVTILVREAYAQPDVKLLPDALTVVRPYIHTVYADLRHFDLTLRAVRETEPEVVIHLAAAGVTDPFLGVETAVRHNVNGTVNLLRACFEKTNTTRQLIVARTPGERSSMNVYAASKAAAWNFCQMYGRTQQWPIVGAMVYQAYGPGQTVRNLIPAAVAAAQAGQDFPMTAGIQLRDWIYVADVVAGIQAMMAVDLPPGVSLDLGGGEATAVAEVVRLIYQLTGRGGKPLIGALPSRPGEEPTQIAAAARTQEMIGWHAAVSLAEGLKGVITHL